MIGFVRGEGRSQDGGVGVPVLLETFLDFHCPFSRKLFGTLQSVLVDFPNVEHRVVIQVQPWHAQASQMSMVVVAVNEVSKGKKTFEMMRAIYERQGEYSDQDAFEMTMRQLYDKLIALAVTVGVDEAALREQLSPERREEVVRELKRHVKYGRQNGIHVSPTVMIHGLVDNTVSSSWSADQLSELLRKLSHPK